VLAIACTFVIITGGIDLSVGTLMTFCRHGRVFLTFWGMPIYVGILAAVLFGALCGFTSGVLVAKLKIPPFIATLGMMMLLKDCHRDIRTKPIYFNDTPSSRQFTGFADRLLHPVCADSQCVLILFWWPSPPASSSTRPLGPLHLRARSNEEAVRLSG